MKWNLNDNYIVKVVVAIDNMYFCIALAKKILTETWIFLMITIIENNSTVFLSKLKTARLPFVWYVDHWTRKCKELEENCILMET